MAATGYIYILINPLMPGLLKIGKTRRTPDARAEELSGDTGVPAEFIVAYETPVSDCDAAEAEIHRKLGNFRSNKNREFFKIDLRYAILTAMEVAAKFPADEAGREEGKDSAESGDEGEVRDGLTALHRACLMNDADMVSVLLRRGADPDGRTEAGVTPLMIAAGKGHSPIVDRLLRAGAKVDAAAADGSTAESLAKERGQVFALNVLNYYRRRLDESEENRVLQLDQVEELVRQGADPDVLVAALEAAARSGAMKNVEVLVAHGVWSQRAAELAEENGHYPIVRVLRESRCRGT
jgi:hypothetical protein